MVRFFVVLFVGLCFASQARANPPANLTQYASEMAGKPVHVTCGTTLKDNYGETESGVVNGVIIVGPDISLSTDTCANLRLLHRHKLLSYDLEANSLITILHEAMHVRLNSEDESKVECTAMYNIWNYIVAYGFTAKQNKRLYRAAWRAHLESPNVYTWQCAMMPGNRVRPERKSWQDSSTKKKGKLYQPQKATKSTAGQNPAPLFRP